MSVVFLAVGTTCAGALGTYLTKSISLRMPVWQVVAPLLSINALLVIPLIPLGGPWFLVDPRVLGLHGRSSLLLCGSTACIFGLIARARPSAVAVGQAFSPARVLLAARYYRAIQSTWGSSLGSCSDLFGDGGRPMSCSARRAEI